MRARLLTTNRSLHAVRENTPHRSEEGWTHTGIRLAGGVVFNPKLSTGFYGQVDYNYIGPLIGLTLVGLEGWKAKEGWGLGIPSSVYLRFPISIGHGESPALMASVRGGWNRATFDRVNEQNQFGIFTPTGSVSFGVSTKRIKILAEGQAEYRWHFTGENRAQFRTGLSLIVNLDN